MKSISTEIVINASKEKVLKILSDFAAYPDWNPFITEILGELKTGAKLKVTLKIEGRKPTSFKPGLISVIPGKKICWQGKLFVKGLFDGIHYFILEETEDGKTQLTQEEIFQGILVNPIMKKIEKPTLNFFRQMNLALKAEAEKQALQKI